MPDNLDDYVIACRSYNRSHIFPNKTYRMLQHNNLLEKLYVFVANKQEKKAYEANVPNFPADRIVVGKLGGAKIIEFICQYFPLGKRIVFMDDDLERFFLFTKEGEYVKDSKALHKYLEDGFKTIDRYNLGSFTFSFLSNPFYLKGKPFKEFRPFIVGGNFFGVRNDRALIPTKVAHADNVLRSSRYFDRYGGTLVYWHAGFSTQYGKEEGGLQASGDRGDVQSRLQITKEVSQSLYNSEHLLQAYANPPIYIENAGLFSLKLKTLPQIRKAMMERGVPAGHAVWDGLKMIPTSANGLQS